MKSKYIVLTGSIGVCLAVVFGAFGSHLLKNVLDVNQLNSYEIGVRYLVYHSLAFLFLGIQNLLSTTKTMQVFAMMSVGIALFTGSLLCLTLKNFIPFSIQWMVFLTPIGGTVLIASWLLFAAYLIKIK